MEQLRIHTTEQLLALLDSMIKKDRSQAAAGQYWSDRLSDPGHPLAHQLPDENLVSWVNQLFSGQMNGLRVLDIGAGNGRNALWLATRGAMVTAVDIAKELLAQYQGKQGIETVVADFVRDSVPEGPYDLIYDSGCFHHIPPHRRETYISKVRSLVVKPSQLFGITTFFSDVLSVAGDDMAITQPEIFNGYTFSIAQLVAMFEPWEPLEVRPMRVNVPHTFGPNYLIAGLFRPIVST